MLLLHTRTTESTLQQVPQIINQLLGQNNPTSCLFVNYPLTNHLTQHGQPKNVFTVPQTTQHFDPAQSTQQFVYRNNPLSVVAEESSI